MRSKSPSPALSVGWVIPSQLLAQGRTSHNMHDQCPHSCQCHCRASSGLMLASDITNLSMPCVTVLSDGTSEWVTLEELRVGCDTGQFLKTPLENLCFHWSFWRQTLVTVCIWTRTQKNIIRVDFHTNILEYNCVQAFPREAFPGKAVLFQLL